MIDRRFLSILVSASALGLAACATTTFQSTWRDPQAAPLNLAGQKVVAMVVVPDIATRKGAEQELAAQLTKRGVEGLPASAVIPDDEIKDKDKVKARLEKAGVAGVVVIEVTGREKEVTASGPTYMGPRYGGFYGGWYGWGWGMPAYSPGYIRTDTLVYVESLVYSLKQDKLVWAGKSQTTNPSRVDGLIKEIVAAAAADMEKQGLIREQ